MECRCLNDDSAMGTYKPAQINNFFVYNSSFTCREGQEAEKILFYHPNDIKQDDQVRTMGLVEAITSFVGTFHDKEKCYCVTTKKTKQFFFHPEPDFWIVMTVGLPYREEEDGSRTYCPDDVRKVLCETILEQIYAKYKIRYGSLNKYLEVEGKESLQLLLQEFFSKALSQLHVERFDLLHSFGGVFFMPLDRQVYLKVVCAVQRVSEMLPQVHRSMLLFHDKLLWSGWEATDTRVLYHHLQEWLDDYLDLSCIPPGPSNQTRMVLAPPWISGKGSVLDHSPHWRVYLPIDVEKPTSYYLLVYMAHSVFLVLFFKEGTDVPSDDLRRMESMLGRSNHGLAALASELSEGYSKRPAPVDNPQASRFFYFNKRNLAQKTNFHSDMKNVQPAKGVPEIMDAFTTMHIDIQREGDKEEGEVMMKTQGDQWMIARQSDGRRFFAVLNTQKGANLIDATVEANRLTENNFQDIFFME